MTAPPPSAEQTRALPKLLALSDEDIKAGRTRPIRAVIEELRAKAIASR